QISEKTAEFSRICFVRASPQASGAAAALAPQSAKENGPIGGKSGRFTLMRQFGGRLGDIASSQKWLGHS
ncbi:MAG: hypothetical protein WBQ20_07895, partial [Methyloceanibacter sp.]